MPENTDQKNSDYRHFSRSDLDNGYLAMSNKLSLNEAKTEIIIFISLRKQLPRDPDIRINNYKLKVLEFAKYLGVFIDEVSSSNKQIDNICCKLSRANGKSSKLRPLLPIKLSVYYSIFYSHLLYGCLVWSYSKQSNIDRISKLQKRYVRILSFSDFNDHVIVYC